MEEEDRASRRSALNRLHKGIGKGLITLEAPTGSGKTDLVAAFVTEFECDARYIALDPSCATPEVLAERVLLALDPNRAPDRSLIGLADLHSLIASSLRSEGRDSPLVIILDNLEHLAGSFGAASVLEAIHSELPPYVDLILSGRVVSSDKLERYALEHDCVWLRRDDFTSQSHFGATLVEPIVEYGSLPGRNAASRADSQPGGVVPDPVKPIAGLLGLMPDMTPESLAKLLGSHASQQVIAALRASPETCEPEFQPGQWTIRRSLCAESSLPATTQEAAANAVAYLLDRGLAHHAAEIAIRMQSGRAISIVLAETGPQALHDGSFGVLRRLTEAAELAPDPADATCGLAPAIKARVEAAAGDPQAALRLIDQTPEFSLSSDEASIHFLIAETVAARLSSDLPRAFEAAKLLEKTIDGPAHPALFEAAVYAGDYYLLIRSDVKKARRLYDAGLRFAEELGIPSLIAFADGKLGDLAHAVGDVPGAIASLERAVGRWEQIGRTSQMARALNNLGMAYASSGAIPAASVALLRAVEVARASRMEAREAYSLASLAELELNFGAPQRARDYLKRALALCSGAIVDERLRALVLADLAACDLKERAFDSAYRQASRSLLLAETSAGPIDQASCRCIMARIQFAMGSTSDAESALLQSIKMFEAAGSRIELLDSQIGLAAFAFESGNHRVAKRRLKDASATAKKGIHKGALLASLRRNPSFAEWVKDKSLLSSRLDDADWQAIEVLEAIPREEHPATKKEAVVYDSSSGTFRMGEGTEHASSWTSPRTRKLFELFLEHREGVEEMEVRRFLSPSDPEFRGNTAMYSAVFELERFLFKGAVIRTDDSLLLDPEVTFKVA